MSDPQRLLAEGANDFERDLLRSWEVEQPSDAARARVLAAAGLGAAVTAVATATKLGAAAGGSIAPKAIVSAGGAVVAKGLAVGAVGLAITGATVGYVRHAARVRRNEEAAARAATPENDATKSAQIAAPAPAPDGVPEAVPVAPTSPHTRNRVTPREHASAVGALGEQVSALDSARRALASGDAASAIRQLDEYEARFPEGALVEEAEVLRVEALVATGDRGAAERAGQRFLAAHPNSPHATRVRALIAP
jgi:TolA-binding protein